MLIGSGNSRRYQSAAGSTRIGGSLALGSGETLLERFATADYDRVTGSERGDERTLTVRTLAEHWVGPVTLRAAVTAADVRFDERINSSPALHYRQRLWSTGVEAEVAAGRSVGIAAGAVLDGADTPLAGDKPPGDGMSAWGGRLGATVRPGSDLLRLHASLSRRSRFPSLRELYSGALGTFVENPRLQPERLTAAEAGVTLVHPRAELQTAIFTNRMDRVIVRVPVGEGRFRRENGNELRSFGGEAIGSWRAGANVRLAADLMIQRVELHDPQLGAVSRPEHMPSSRAGASIESPLASGVRVLARGRFTGRQYCVHPELRADVVLGAQALADLALEREWPLRTDGAVSRYVRSTLALDNLTDAAAYDQCGLPGQGRTLMLRVSVRG